MSTLDPAGLYRRAGLIAVTGPVSFVGTLGFFAGPHPDSTLALLTLSLPARALTFTRDGDRYRANYSVSATMRRETAVVHRFEAKEAVRVATFRETSRGEESVIFQEYFELPPGTYTLAVAVEDGAGLRKGEFQGEVIVPAAGRGGVLSSLPVHEAIPRASVDSLPQLVASPRSTAVFGRDTLLTAYVEVHELPSDQPVHAAVRGERGATLWSDSVSLSRAGSFASGLVHIPVTPLGIGAVELLLWRQDGGDTTRTPFFVSFGDDLPVATFDDMLSYLRFYVAPSQRLVSLRDAPPEERTAAWTAFLRESDPEPTTPQHEGLQAYFARIQRANQDFREEGSGWLSDRGMVFVALGDPDDIQPNRSGMSQRGQSQTWLYYRHQLQLVFVDQTGFNRWRLTPNSELAFQNLLRREQGG
jgi:GWxTD domain-containing protein